MNAVECAFEAEALAAVVEFRWPDQVDPRLREHVSRCAICSGLVFVADALLSARAQMPVPNALPDPSRVWWSAQLRARREAIVGAARPITAAQVIAFAWALGLSCVCVGVALTWFHSTRTWVYSAFAAFDAGAFISAVTTLFAQHGALIVSAAALLFLLPAAAYLALGRD